MPNQLQYETSPYLLQHADNPVDWYPWGEQAFIRAREQDKPVFLSIGYSTCHWCHVMARESFADPEIAALLNRHFISVKVDREERPDIDSVYMRFCMSFTGSGGWPTSIFMTADQKPFFAGTYFPKENRGGMYGLKELLPLIADQWQNNRSALIAQANRVVRLLRTEKPRAGTAVSGDLPQAAFQEFARSYDPEYGGFGSEPKFPTAHNLLFLLAYGRLRREPHAVEMAEQTLFHMIRGGLFDQIGGGFCRYSTDRKYLVPHFEKMLYDNALLIIACCAAATGTKDGQLKALLLSAAGKTGEYVLRELQAPEGGFYSAQDADSEGVEGKYYLFTPEEIIALLGEETGTAFCRRFDITPEGNFAGMSIPNLIHSDLFDPSMDVQLPRVREYREGRMALQRDKNLLTAWNGLMIAAMCVLYRTTREETYLAAAERADAFLKSRLMDRGVLCASYACGRRGTRGFLDDYAAFALAQLALYGATLKADYLRQAEALCSRVISDFSDADGGFYLTSADAERLLLRSKETYDGAMPSGNSLMAWNLARLYEITQKESWRQAAEKQLAFLDAAASDYPAWYAMGMLSHLAYDDPTVLTAAVAQDSDLHVLPFVLPLHAAIRLQAPTEEYPLLDGRTAYYLCSGHSCLPPVNQVDKLKKHLESW